MARRKKYKTKNYSEWVSVPEKRKGSKSKKDDEGEDLNDELWICQGCNKTFQGDNHKLQYEYC